MNYALHRWSPRIAAPWIALVLSLLAASSVSAAGPEEILFLGIKGPNGPHERAGKAVLRRLERVGEAASDPPLTPMERSCRTLECLRKLATNYKAAWVLGGEVQSSDRKNYTISLWLFQNETGRQFEQGEECEGCDADALDNAVSTATGHLLDQRPPAPPIPEQKPVSPSSFVVGNLPSVVGGQVTSPVVTSHEAPVLRRSRVKLTTGRKIAAATLAAALAVTLANSIVFSAVKSNDQSRAIIGNCPFPAPGSQCEYKPYLQAIGYSLSGVLAAGLTLTLTLP